MMSRRVALLFVAGWVAGWPLCHAAPIPEERTSLRILTYNVLADPVHVQQRVPELLRIMREADADIIALQEVAPWFARELLRESWVKPYQRATRDGKTLLAHEHIILSRFPVIAEQTLPLPGTQLRVAHVVTLDIDGTPTAVATCHLESLLEDGPMRARQLSVFFEHLAPLSEAFFAGDFNFGDGEQPETSAIPGVFRDAWLVVRPADAGYTWDMKRSRMARDTSFPGERSRRLDRILFRSARWTPVSAALVGDAATPGPSKNIFPSDHFGVLAVFARVEAHEASAAP